jgi:hypothetical protein
MVDRRPGKRDRLPMTDPFHVNERIAAIMNRYQNHFWCGPEALAEARSLWGEGANEHGVFCRHDRVEIARPSDSCKAAVLIAESGNGLFVYGLEYGFRLGEGDASRRSGGRRSDRGRRPTRRAWPTCIEHIGRHPADKRQAKLLRRGKRQGQQRTLFD